MATIREVAKVAGVSVGSVSRYLNGYRLKKENMENIQQAIEELQFKENIIAKGLKNKKTLAVGVVINSLTDVFATSIVSYLETFLEQNNYSILICDYNGDLDRLKIKLDFLYNRSVDGLVIFHLEEKLPILEKMQNEGVFIVAVDAPIKDFTSDAVLIDNYAASYQATSKLIEYGHKQIGIIAGDTSKYIGKQRLLGYEMAMKEHGFYNQSFIKLSDYTRETGRKKTLELLKEEHLTALYTVNYYTTLGAVQALRQLKLEVPEDISLVGFDYFETFDIFSPKLNVIVQPVKQIAEKISDVLLRKLQGIDIDTYEKIELSTDILWRESVKKIN